VEAVERLVAELLVEIGKLLNENLKVGVHVSHDGP
jgi:hypothetical protein